MMMMTVKMTMTVQSTETDNHNNENTASTTMVMFDDTDFSQFQWKSTHNFIMRFGKKTLSNFEIRRDVLLVD